MVCVYHSAVYRVHRSCLSYFLMVSSDVVDIGSECFVVVRIYMFAWLCRATCCSVLSISMLGVSYAVLVLRLLVVVY